MKKPNSIDSDIGKQLNKLRRRAGISQTALGKHLGVSFQQIQKYENGINRLSVALAIKISRYLSVPGHRLLNVAQPTTKLAITPEVRMLVRSYLAIRQPLVRYHIANLISALSY